MRSRTVNLKIPNALVDCMRPRALMAGYSSVNQYLVGLVRKDISENLDHHSVVGVAVSPLSRQDLFDDAITEPLMIRLLALAAEAPLQPDRKPQLGFARPRYL